MTTCKKMHIQMQKNAYDHAKKCTCTCKIMHMHMQKNAYAHANECTYICIFSCILKFYWKDITKQGNIREWGEGLEDG